jgi:hypothetical protein
MGLDSWDPHKEEISSGNRIYYYKDRRLVYATAVSFSDLKTHVRIGETGYYLEFGEGGYEGTVTVCIGEATQEKSEPCAPDSQKIMKGTEYHMTFEEFNQSAYSLELNVKLVKP